MNQAIEQAIINQTNKVWEQALKVGMVDERERIIKLLDDKSTEIQFEAIGSSHSSASYALRIARGLEYAIELIKRETK
jgi:adenylate kinase